MIDKFAQRLEGWQAKYLSFGGKTTIIKSVLSSLPIHIFSCMSVPKQVLRQMEDLMASFIWSENGQHRIHWVAWKKTCKPVEQGGLGIRSVTDMICGLHGKIACKIMSQNSLWTRKLLQKYGDRSIYANTPPLAATSKLWRTVFPHFQNFLQLSHWQLGKGDISSWCANWCGEIIIP